MNICLQGLELSVFTAVSKLQDLFAILCAALLAYYYLLTSMTVSYCKVLDVRAFYDLFSRVFRTFQDSCM